MPIVAFRVMMRHVGWKGPKKVCDVIYPQILDG